jgi:hypothetical protein
MKSNILVAANYDGSISTFHTASSNLIAKIKVENDHLLAMDISHDDHYICTAGKAHKITLID